MKVKCKHCEIEFDKKPNQIKKDKNNFCCRSHAAIYNNKMYQKRAPTKWRCMDCDKKVSHGSKRCQGCKRIDALKIYNSHTIEEKVYKKGDASLKFVYIRKHAGIVLELENRKKKCEACEWDKHVHVAHIKALSSFDLTTKIGVVNAPENLKYLCPNCHWEFDHN
jgi:hypothetical protein